MNKYITLKDFLLKNAPSLNRKFNVGGVLDPEGIEFPLYGIKVKGAVLFADLPGYSRNAKSMAPEECAFMTNHFFTWVETFAVYPNGGIVDKFIGDEIMIVFSDKFCQADPMESSLSTAKIILDKDLYGFEPKIGISFGEFFITLVGSDKRNEVSIVGNTVNLAARCVGSAKSRQIKIISTNTEKVSKIFNDENWIIEGPTMEKFKNVDKHEVVTISKTSFRMLNFDYLQMVKNKVEEAYRLENE